VPLEPISYLVKVTFPGEDNDDLGVCRMVTTDICDLAEGHYVVKTEVVEGFDRLMDVARQILAEHYPPDVFGTADDPDSDASDPGVRLVRALRACEAAQSNGKEAGC
jgi:hypothetical protein